MSAPHGDYNDHAEAERVGRLAALREVEEGIASRLATKDAKDMSIYEVGEHNARVYEAALIRELIAKEVK
jgi:hypothetical protein